MTRLDADLNILINAEDKASKHLSKIDKELLALERRQEALSKVGKTLGLVGAGITAGLVAMTVAGEEQAATQRKLAVAIENTGRAAETVSPRAELLMSDLQALTGVSDELQRQALTNLITVLGDVDQAMAALPTVLDATASSGKSLNETSLTMAKALAGQVHMAESVGIQFDKTADFGERLALVNSKVGGSAEAAATPSAKLQASLADIGDTVATVLAPAMEKLATLVADVSRWFNNADPAIQKAAVALTAFTGVFLGSAGLLVLIPKATIALGTLKMALIALTGPIGWVVGALGLAVGAGLAWALSETEEATDAAVEAQQELAAQAPKTAKAVEDGAKRAEEAAKRMADATAITDAAIKKTTAAVADELAAKGLAETTDDLRLSVLEAFNLLPENAGRMVNDAGQYVTSFEEQLNTFEDRWARLPESVQNALLANADVLIEQLGIQEEHLRLHGDQVESLLHAGYINADAAASSVVTGMREKLAVLFAGITADHQKAMQDGIAQPTVEMADTVESEMDRVDGAITKVFENLPETLKASLNTMSTILEDSFNKRLLPYFNNIVEILNQFAELPDAPAGFGNIPFIDPLNFPAYRMGTGFAVGGRSIVNEAAGELVTLPYGAGVVDAGNSTRLIEAIKTSRSTDGGRGPVTIAGDVYVVADSPQKFLDELELLG